MLHITQDKKKKTSLKLSSGKSHLAPISQFPSSEESSLLSIASLSNRNKVAPLSLGESLPSTFATAHNQAAARFLSTSTNIQLPPSDALTLQPPTKRVSLKPRQSALRKSRVIDHKVRRVKDGIATLEEKYGKPIEDLLTSHPGNDIDFTIPRFRSGAEEMNIPPECLVDASLSTKVDGVKPDAPLSVLRGDSEFALPQQNGFDLTAKQVLRKHYDAVYIGTSCNYGGFTLGSLGTKTSQRKTVDTARSTAARAIYEDGKGVAVVHERNALEIDVLVPLLAKEGQYGVLFIGENNQRLNHTNMSKAEFKEIVENDARGFEVRDPVNMDSFLERIDRELKKKRKNDDNKKEEKARSKKVKITWEKRNDMMKRFTSSTTKMRFTHERFDEKGIVDATFGPNSNRRKNAGHRFTIVKNDMSFKVN